MRKALVAMFCFIVACDGHTVTEAELAPDSGTWVLRAINNYDLPYTLINQSGGTYIMVTADTIELLSSGKFSRVAHYQRRVTTGVVDFPVTTSSGTWTLQGTNVKFRELSGETFSAQFQGTAMGIVGGGFLSVYTR